MYRYFISLITSLVFTCTALCDTVSFVFPSNCDTLRNGNVICPNGKNNKTIFIYVNNRMSNSKDNFEYYSELTDKLLSEGISCCYYDNRPILPEDAASPTTLFDMANDAVSVYHALKTNKRFKNYKIGFYGASEAGSSALIAASMVPNPAFLVQQSACVIPQIEKDFLIYTIYQLNLIAMSTNPKFLGMPYYRYASMIREINEELKGNRVNDTKAYAQIIINKYFSDLSEDKKAICNRMLPELVRDMANKLGIANRLIWNARPYYKNTKCPILYIAGLQDTNVFGIPNIIEFERIMLENGHKKFNSILVDVNHQMLTSQEVFEKRYRHKEPVGVKRCLIWDSIKKWIMNNKQ